MTRRKRAGVPASALAWQARKVASQAAKLADQAAPITRKAAVTARQQAGGAADWARPRVGRLRAALAAGAARGSVSVQETVAPRVSAMLAATARRLDPPRQPSRRWPKVVAGTAVLAAAGTAAAAVIVAMRPRETTPVPPRPATGQGGDPSVKVVKPGSEPKPDQSRPEFSGLPRPN